MQAQQFLNMPRVIYPNSYYSGGTLSSATSWDASLSRQNSWVRTLRMPSMQPPASVVLGEKQMMVQALWSLQFTQGPGWSF